MPSGAKKRKAAKKKKEQLADHTSSSAAHFQGDSEVLHAQKDSHGGEADSPSSQEQHVNQSPFAEGEEEEARTGSSSVDANKSMGGSKNDKGIIQTIVNEEEDVIQIDWEMKSADESESYVTHDIIGSSRKLHVEGSSGSSSSSSSSSDDEPRIFKKKTTREEMASVVDLVEVVDPLSQTVAKFSENNPVVEAYECPTESVLVVDSANLFKEEEFKEMNENATVGFSVSSNVIDLGLKINEENLPSSVGNTEVAEKKEESEVVLVLEHCFITASGAKASAEQAEEDKVLSLSSTARKVAVDNGWENRKFSEFPECSDNQVLASAPSPPVQTTSWKSCCGLFEVLTGSNR